jgi:hypothetical protein
MAGGCVKTQRDFRDIVVLCVGYTINIRHSQSLGRQVFRLDST